MYIEQLTENDFKKFADIFDCGIAKIKTTENNGVYLQLFTEAMGPQPEVWLFDFNLTTSTYYKFAEKELKTQYIHFMHDKFGEKYQQDYTENYNKKTEKERII